MAGEQPAAIVVTSRLKLAERLAMWPSNDGLMTWALVVVSPVPSPAELGACREAAKLCDAVVALCITMNLPLAPNFAEVVRSGGVDMVWVAKEAVGPVVADVGVTELAGDGATLLLQAVTTVLPTLVVVPRGNLLVIRACRNILNGLGDLFSLRLLD